MSNWPTAIEDLRVLLSDNPTDKMRYRKRCFGEINGENKIFKTFETRRVTTFKTGVAAPYGAYVSGTLALASFDDPITGEFELITAPTDGQVVEASYNYQWFTDSELELFLKSAAQWLVMGRDYQNVIEGLQPAAMHFAGQSAYHKLAVRWSERWSEIYLLNDAPQEKNAGPVDNYLKIADTFHKKAVELRDSFYGRDGQNLAPLWGTAVGAIGNVTPSR